MRNGETRASLIAARSYSPSTSRNRNLSGHHQNCQTHPCHCIPDPSHARRVSILRLPFSLSLSLSLSLHRSLFFFFLAEDEYSTSRLLSRPPTSSRKLNKKPSWSLSAAGNHALSYIATQDDRRKKRGCLSTTGSRKFLFIEDLISVCSSQNGTSFDLHEPFSSIGLLFTLSLQKCHFVSSRWLLIRNSAHSIFQIFLQFQNFSDKISLLSIVLKL